MQNLINALVSEVGVTTEQAEGGAAAILSAAHERLGPAQFDELLGKLPGINALRAKAPSKSGGGMLGALAGKFGGGDIAQAMQLLTAFNSLGMNKDTAMKFIPVLMGFLESQGGQELVQRVRAALKF